MRQLNIIRNRKEYTIRHLEFNYDKLNDLLYVYKKKSSVYSNVMIGEFHLEFSKDREVVGVEILKASELLGEYDIPKKFLENIENINIKVVVRNNSLLIFLIIHSLNKEKSAAITMNNLESPIMREIATA